MIDDLKRLWRPLLRTSAFLGLAGLTTASALAHVPYAPREELIRAGFRPIEENWSVVANSRAPELARNLPWPVKFSSTKGHTIAQNYFQFQNLFGNLYLHGGVDLRVDSASEVTAPIAGTLSGGLIVGTRSASGEYGLMWNPWQGERYDGTYFTLMIETAEGDKLILLHINPNTLPSEIATGIRNGGKIKVPAGSVIGHAMTWPIADYHHVHYEILTRDGLRANPEHYSRAVADSQAPVIHAVYGVLTTGQVIAIPPNQSLKAKLAEIVVSTTDGRDADYIQPPTFLSLTLNEGKRTTQVGWDFRKNLLALDGTAGTLDGIYRAQLTLPSGAIEVSNQGPYPAYASANSLGKTFLMRLPLPTAGLTGKCAITAQDYTGNAVKFDFEITP